MCKYLLPILLLGIGAANAQDLTIERNPSLVPPLVVTPPVVEVPIIVDSTLPPLTADSARIARQRLETYLDDLGDVAPKLNTLTAAGLSKENDAVERPTSTPAGMVGPSYVALGRKSRSPASKDAVDPGLAETSRVVLRARLGREPTAAELNADLQAFDRRVANVNQALAEMRPRIADTMKRTGRFPRSLEAGVLGVTPADPQAGSAAAAEGFRRLFQTLLTLPSPSQPSLPNSTPR
jgi:hypothetical protein